MLAKTEATEEKSTKAPLTSRDPVITAEPEKGKPAPPPALSAYEAVKAYEEDTALATVPLTERACDAVTAKPEKEELVAVSEKLEVVA